MKKATSFLVAASAALLSAAAQPLDIIVGGSTSYTVVVSDAMPETDAFLLADFTNLLHKASGAEFAVARMSGAPAARRLFFGVAPEGEAPLADQERRVVTRGCDLYIYGGGTNGTRYAAYDFLVNDLGYRFFDARGGMRVSDAKTFRMAQTDRRRRHDFAERYISLWGRYKVPESTMFMYRHGINGKIAQLVKRDGLGPAANDYDTPYPGDASLVQFLPRNAASCKIGWIKALGGDLEKEHPEYFTLDANGKRVFGHQRCLSNPDVRALLEKRVFEHIRRNPDGTVFDVSAGDTPGRFCWCDGCRALEDKYGTKAGPILDFLLAECPKVGREFPGRSLMTLVYRKDQTQRPPKGDIRLPGNFVAHFAPIDDDFTKDWTHPNNADTLADLREWRRLGAKVFMWYYPNPYGEDVTPPFGNVERLANDIRIMKECGVSGATFEHNVGVTPMTGFTELQTYVMLRLFDDASRDWRADADEFLEFEYGAAAAAVKAYWLELEELRKGMSARLPWNPQIGRYEYLTKGRMKRWAEAFDAMEASVAGDSVRLANVRRLRFALDICMLRLCGGGSDRVRAGAAAIAKDCFSPKYGGQAKAFLANIEELVFMEEIKSGGVKPLPADVFGGVPEERVFVTMARCPWRRAFVPDPKAAFGKAAVFDGEHRGDVMAVPFRANVEHVADKKYITNVGRVEAKDLGPRGEYRFYRLGSTTVTRSTVLELGAWSAFRCQIGGAYEEGSFNKVRLYASLRFQGSAFYPEDKDLPNMIYCDRVVVVKE